MLKLTRLLVVLGAAALLQACTATSGIFDNNCSGNAMVMPSGDYCSAYTSGQTP